MNPGAPTKENLRLRTSLRGKERWEVDGLLRKPLLGGRIQCDLSGRTGVVEAAANPLTGRVMVRFDPDAVKPGEAGEMILSVLQIVFEETLALDDGAPEEEASRRSGKLKDNELLGLINAMETDHRMRRRAVRLSVANTLVKLVTALSFGLIIVVPISGGLVPLAQLGLTSRLSQIGFLSGLFFLLRGGELWLEKSRTIAWSAYAAKIEQSLRLRTFEHTLGLDMAHLENQSTDKLMSLINADAEMVKRFLDYSPPNLIDKFLTLVLGSAVVMLVSPVAFLLTYLPFPVAGLLHKSYKNTIDEKFRESGVHSDRFNRILLNNLQGFPTIKSYTSEEKEIGRLSESGESLYRSELDCQRANVTLSSGTVLALGMGVCLPLIYGCFGIARGTISFIQFMMLSSILPTMMRATAGFGQTLTSYQDALYASKRLTGHMAGRARIVDGETRLPIEEVRGEFVFEKVSFGYGAEPVLHEIDLHIPENGTAALVGPTGFGKTTLTKLLLRFYDVDQGRITLDAHDIRDLNLRDLRRAIGLVSQDVYLFNGAIYENILYGRPDASRDEVIEASIAAEAHDFIRDLPDGYDALVGERGQKLSGGQRQRISIARAILKNPPVLILDEATSSVDNETEAAIQRSIHRISKNRTIIIIAHRLSTVRHADCIYLLKNAAILERGTHDELIEKKGEYAFLWNLQTEEKHEPEADEPMEGRGL